MKYTIPLLIEEIEHRNYHVFVALKVGDKPCRLLLDTGASKTVFDAGKVLRFVADKKIRSHPSNSVGLGVSEMDTQIATLKDISFGKLKRKKLLVAVLDLAHVNQTYKSINLPEIDGVLGSDILMKYKAVINYRTATLKLEK